MAFNSTTTINGNVTVPSMVKNGRTLGSLHDMGVAFGGTPLQNNHQNGSKISFIDAFSTNGNLSTRFIFNGNGASYTNKMAIMPTNNVDVILQDSLWEVGLMNANKGWDITPGNKRDMAVDMQLFCNSLRRMGRTGNLPTALNTGAAVSGSGLAVFNPLNETDVIARMLYSEAQGESYEGKRGCAAVLRNRKAKNNLSEFGGNVYKNMVLHPNQFAGMHTSHARQPDLTNSITLAAWCDCMDIAANIDAISNPIGNCLWFWTNDLFNSVRQVVNGVEQVRFGNGPWVNVVEKVIIGKHTFFRVAGY